MKLNDQHIEALVKARRAIQSQQSIFICIAIMQCDDVEGDNGAAMQLRRRIEEVLHPHATLPCWLIDQGVAVSATNPKTLRRVMRQFRLAWIDQMIATRTCDKPPEQCTPVARAAA